MKFHGQVDLAKSGEQAITLANREAYDLIVLDMRLPDIDGTEVARTIRGFENPERSQVPIIALTGHAGNAAYQQSCFDVGIQAILNKPADKDRLADIFQKYVIHSNRK